MHINFCAISFSRTQNLHFPKNSEKIVTTTPLIKLCPQKLYQCHLLKQVYCTQNFARFHAIESEIGLTQEFWEKWNGSAPC